jgi:hypothetical protein
MNVGDSTTHAGLSSDADVDFRVHVEAFICAGREGSQGKCASGYTKNKTLDH